MKKWQIENLKNLGKSVPSFRFCPTAFCPNFRDFRGFQVFDLAPPKPKKQQQTNFQHDYAMRDQYEYEAKNIQI